MDYEQNQRDERIATVHAEVLQIVHHAMTQLVFVGEGQGDKVPSLSSADPQLAHMQSPLGRRVREALRTPGASDNKSWDDILKKITKELVRDVVQRRLLIDVLKAYGVSYVALV